MRTSARGKTNRAPLLCRRHSNNRHTCYIQSNGYTGCPEVGPGATPTHRGLLLPNGVLFGGQTASERIVGNSEVIVWRARMAFR